MTIGSATSVQPDSSLDPVAMAASSMQTAQPNQPNPPNSPVQSKNPSGPFKPAIAFNAIASEADILNRTIKVIIPVLEIISTILGTVGLGSGVAAGCKLLKGRLNDTKSVINASGVFARPNDWINKTKETIATPAKTVKNVTLTIGQTMEFVGFVDKVSLGNLAAPAACVGAVPIFEIVKCSFISISAVFGIYLSAKSLEKASPQLQKYRGKIEQLKEKSEKNDVIKQISKIHTDKIEKLQAKIDDADTTDENKAKYKAKIVESQARNSELEVEDDTALSTAKNQIDAKIARIEEKMKPVEFTVKRSWLSIAADVAKIAAIAIGLTALGLAATFSVLTLPAAVVGLAAINLTASGIALAKALYDKLEDPAKNKTVAAAA